MKLCGYAIDYRPRTVSSAQGRLCMCEIMGLMTYESDSQDVSTAITPQKEL